MLKNITPLDGRYHHKTQELQNYFSEYALIKTRVFIELQYLKALSSDPEIKELENFNNQELASINNIIKNFTEKDAAEIKEIEKTTNHDVKAVEYFLKNKLQNKITDQALEFIHLACTSEDINNLSYALMTKTGVTEVVLPAMHKIEKFIISVAREWKNIAMLSRTHGQTASPTTLGKEFWVFYERLNRQLQILEGQDYLGKLNGAVGNFNAHLVAYPNFNWPNFSRSFISSLGLKPNLATTQIEPHDYLAELAHNVMRINNILLDLCRDIWGYISLGYFSQQMKENEVGSSTMPHKINPIDFENAEGNLGLANSLFAHLANKLPISRWQRDLTDSTVQRNLGSAFAYSLIAYQSVLKGLNKLKVNEATITADLESRWEVLAEPIQTVMRKYGLKNPYEKLKAFTRGKAINQENIQALIQSLAIPEAEKNQLLQLTPSNYLGLAADLVK